MREFATWQCPSAWCFLRRYFVLLGTEHPTCPRCGGDLQPTEQPQKGES